MAGDQVMKGMPGFPRGVIVAAVLAVALVAFNVWLTRQMERIVGAEVRAEQPGRRAAEVPSGAYIPAIDPNNDLLAPVARPVSPHMYLKRVPQKNSGAKEYGLPGTGHLLVD